MVESGNNTIVCLPKMQNVKAITREEQKLVQKTFDLNPIATIFQVRKMLSNADSDDRAEVEDRTIPCEDMYHHQRYDSPRQIIVEWSQKVNTRPLYAVLFASKGINVCISIETKLILYKIQDIICSTAKPKNFHKFQSQKSTVPY